ncbi:Rho Guanine Nucleotide Exchange Factor 5 [Manis pentadactyla]|nr:Rho Guanine Nucleotide Exchange Factor 5 [Manis pentadactyla]
MIVFTKLNMLRPMLNNSQIKIKKISNWKTGYKIEEHQIKEFYLNHEHFVPHFLERKKPETEIDHQNIKTRTGIKKKIIKQHASFVKIVEPPVSPVPHHIRESTPPSIKAFPLFPEEHGKFSLPLN